MIKNAEINLSSISHTAVHMSMDLHQEWSLVQINKIGYGDLKIIFLFFIAKCSLCSRLYQCTTQDAPTIVLCLDFYHGICILQRFF